MRTARRTDFTPRVEMVPLIDVVFLLLTFFIYSLAVMVQAEILPVELTPLTTGERAAPDAFAAITIDRAGALYLNREPIESPALDAELQRMAEQADPPKLFLAMQEAAEPAANEAAIEGEAERDTTAGEGEIEQDARAVDRGPLLIELIERVRRAGLSDFSIVGAPSESGTNAERTER